MFVIPTHAAQLQTMIPNNPTDAQRHEMVYNSLINAGRFEDYENLMQLISPAPDITRYGNPGEFKGIKAGIVGGGLAGMSTAFELRKLGFDITIFEPHTERVGGRVYTYYFDKDKKLYGELGAMRIPASHETVWHYINLFRLDTEPFIQTDPNTFIYVRDVRVRNDFKGENVSHLIYPQFGLTTKEANTPWLELYNKVNKYYMSTMPPEVRKQLLMILPKYDYRYEALQDISIRQAKEQYGLSSEAINLIASVVPSIGGLIFHSSDSELQGEYTLDFENLYRISGGMVNLPLAFYKSLTAPSPAEYSGIPHDALGRITWKSGFAVTGILKSGEDGKVTLRYRRLPALEDIYEDFDYVICASPLTTLRPMDIFPAFSVKKMQVIRGVYYEDAQKTLFLCRERFWEKQGIFGGTSYTDQIINLIIYPEDHAHCTQDAAKCSPNEPGVLLASYNVGEDAYSLGNFASEAQYPIVRSQVEKVHGLPRGYLDQNKIITASKIIDWVSEPWFHGAFQMFLPGQKREFLYVSSTPEYDNRVFFAGEHTARKNGWIQGALWSGMVAANDVVQYAIIHKYQK